MNTQESLRSLMCLFSSFPESSSDRLCDAAISEQFFACASTPMAIVGWDGSLRQINAAYEALLEDFQPDISLFWFDSVHPDDRATVQSQWQALIQRGRAGQIETRWLSRDGVDRWFVWQLTPIASQQFVYAVGQDISAYRQSEFERQQHSVLKESEQRLQAILDQSEAVIYLKDRQGRYLLVNRQYERLYQTTQTQLRGQTNQAVLEPETADLFWSYDLEVLETGTPLKFEERLYLPDGVHTYLSVKFPLLNTNGTADAVCSISTDITDRKQIELERERYAEQSFRLLQQEQVARAQAEQANRIKDEFLAVLSHELRTPLNPILGWSKLLQNRQLSPEKVQQGLETIERNVKLQAQLIDDLLDISRILRGKLVLDMKPVDLAEPIGAALETVRMAAEAKSIQLSTQSEAPLQQVFGDASRLQQILWNLLSNAIKFTPAGGQVTVRVVAALPQDPSALGSSAAARSSEERSCQIPFVQIQVIDTGKGIRSEFLPHVFEHFRQQDSSTTRQFGGLGLGLAIVRQLVEAHGGTITVDSRGEGQGTTFAITLPLLLTIEQEQDRQSANSTSLNLQGVRVLLVEDDADTQALIAYLLEQQQLCVTAVGSAQEALTAIKTSRFDVLISDIGMPQMDGYALMRQIRANAGTDDLLPGKASLPKAIALTAYASEFDQQQAFAAGFQTHLAKPLALEALLQAIADLVKPE